MASLGDGVFASVMMGVVDTFLTPFALALQASPRQIGWLISLPGLFGALAQWWTGHLTRLWKSRKTVLLRVVAGQAMVLLLTATVPWWPKNSQIPALVLLFTAYACFGGISGPVWNSLMADYLPARTRAGYFGWRNQITGVVVIASALGAGAFLHLTGRLPEGPSRLILRSFASLLVLSAACRWISFAYIRHFYESKISAHSLLTGKFTDFFLQTRGGPFWNFTLCMACLTFSANLAGPYVPVYMLSGLRFSYLTFTLATIAFHLSIAFMMGVWGRTADRVGIVKVLRLCIVLTSVIPPLWLLSKAPIYVFFLQVFGGLAWSGVNLCTMNYLFESVPDRLRTQAIAYFNVINGVSLAAGAFLGGYLMSRLPPLFGFSFLALLQISGILRGAVAVVLLPKVAEQRPEVESVFWKPFLDALGAGTAALPSRSTVIAMRPATK